MTPLSRTCAFAALASLSVALNGCGGGGTDAPLPPVPSAPAAIAVQTSPSSSATVGTSAGTFSVKVIDNLGLAVPNVSVAFTTTGTVTVAPATTTTDAAGLATTQVTAGTVAGSVSVTATATGVAPSTVPFQLIAGAATKVLITPKTVRLVYIGDSARVTATGQDQYGNVAPPGSIVFAAVDPTLVSVDATGMVKVLKQGGTTGVTATSATKADTSAVTVLAAGSSYCTGLVASTPLAVGGVATFSGSQYGCVDGGAAGAEFVLTAFNSSTDQTGSLSASVVGTGLATPPSTSIVPPSTVSAMRAAGSGTPSSPTIDRDFHLSLLQAARDRALSGIGVSPAARVAGSRMSTSTGISRSSGSIPSVVNVGDIITVNVSASGCGSPLNHGLRVAAVGVKSIVLADTLNPAGGFTDTDYQKFAARFDTLIYPLDVGAFGTPTDIDSNGKIGILFTRAVNELTAQSSSSFVGGFFFSRDLFPKATTTQFGAGCTGSNEGEMFYMLAPDSLGVAYKGSTGTPSASNVRRKGFVDSLTTGTIAHEFQHLINASRRIYVNTTASDYEIVWLNEGLSHIAEELLYYRETGKSPRSNLTDADIRLASSANYAIWKQDAAQNFQRFSSYLSNPTATSPDVENDILATRGATWSFLRYAADRTASTDGTIWSQLVNSTTQGFGTLRLAFGSDIVGLLRDYTLANYLDDSGFSTDPHYQHLSWNFRDIYTKTFIAGVYPLQVTGLASGASVSVSVARNSAGYYRFTVPAGGEGRVSLAASGSAPSSALQFIVVRTK